MTERNQTSLSGSPRLNILINGDFAHGLTGWRCECQQPDTRAGLDLSPEWKLPNTPTAYLGSRHVESGASMARSFHFATTETIASLRFEGDFASHRSAGVLELSFKDSQGNNAGIERRDILHHPKNKGGTSRRYYEHIVWDVSVPEGAVAGELKVSLGAHVPDEAPSRYLFFHSLTLLTPRDREKKEVAAWPGQGGAASPPIRRHVDIVVAVHNALADVRECLQSLAWFGDGLLGTVFVVNDGSDAETSEWLRGFCATHASFRLIDHERSLGFSRSMNDGLKLSEADYAVVLNSDTIVTRGWLASMVACMESDPAIGIVGPLSNAASWQNVPELLGPDKKFAVNELPQGMTPNQMAVLVRRAASRTYPRVRFLNGFCFMVRREVFETIGHLDARSFPRGYGEENDFCIRAAEAGFQLAVTDDAYVFHAKSKSFGHEVRRELSDQGMATLKRKHTAEKVEQLIQEQRRDNALTACRDRVRSAFETYKSRLASADITSLRPLFVLPCRGGGGGAHSVMQEVAAMREMGVEAAIAVRRKDLDEFRELYADVAGVREIFRPFDKNNIVEAMPAGCSVAVGTIFTSMKLVKNIIEERPAILPAYYIQDYEPWFVRPGTTQHREALESYTLVPNTICFAKTHWLCHLVQEKHGVEVAKVAPSLDHSVYKPGVKPDDGRIHICAMVRPSTPRRAAGPTMELMAGLHREFGEQVALHVFGCAPDSAEFLLLERNFPHTHHGILRRPEVAGLLGRCHMFIDMSEYQAFGRTGLEAMACGCIPAVTRWGGTGEYISEQGPGLLLDTLDQVAAEQAVAAFIRQQPQPTESGAACIEIASSYSAEEAARNICELLATSRSRLIPSPTSCLS